MKISKNNSHFFPSGVVYIIGGTMRPGRAAAKKSKFDCTFCPEKLYRYYVGRISVPARRHGDTESGYAANHGNRRSRDVLLLNHDASCRPEA